MNNIIFVVLMILFFISQVSQNIFRETEQYRSKTQEQKTKMNTWWHRAQYIGWLISVGVATYFKFDGFTLIFFKFNSIFISTWWIFYDGTLNMYRNKPFWRVSTTTTSDFEKLGQPKIKILLLILTIIFISGVII